MGIENSHLFGDREMRGHKGSNRAARFLQLGCFLCRFSEHSVHKRSRGTFARTLHKFHGFVNRRMHRHALQKPELIDTQTQRDPHLSVQGLRRIRHIAADQKIQQPLPAQNSQRQFSCQSRVFGANTGANFCMQNFVRISALRFDAPQDIKRNRSCRRNRHKQTWNHTLPRKGTRDTGV